MAKVTEKSLKARCTELNIGALKDTTFGLRFNRTGKGYTVELQYRVQPQLKKTDDCDNIIYIQKKGGL